MNKERMIEMLEEAKDIVREVYQETEVDEVGDLLCSIDEATNAIEDKKTE